MIPAPFDYVRAGSLEEAVRLLGERAGAKALAGGHSLLPMMKLRLAQPETVVDIGRVAELRGVTEEDGAFRVGALTTHAELASSEQVRARCPLLAEAAGEVGDPQVRNRGTIGGNIAHADPASDLPAVLVASAATVHLLGGNGERSVAADDFFIDLLTTDLQAGELITAVTVPACPAGCGCAYLKVEHPASGYALCAAAARVVIRDGSCTEAALCFNGVTPRPFVATAVASALVGGDASDDAIDAAVNEHLEIDDPLGDIHASEEYRVELARVHGRRALKQARERATA